MPRHEPLNEVQGVFSDVIDHGAKPGCFKKQTFTTEWKPITYYGDKAMIRAKLRFDDECGNGHNTFTITGEIVKRLADGSPSQHDRGWLAGGCCHEEIAKHFKKLAPLIKWHLTSSDAPLHYIANTLYHAGDLDCHGLAKGEKRQIINGKSGLPAWHLVAFDEAGEEIQTYSLPKSADGLTPPESTFALRWVPWCRVGEGKTRDLNAARSAAVWPEATDAELSAPREVLKAALEARHAALMASFKADMIAAGFQWEPQTVEA